MKNKIKYMFIAIFILLLIKPADITGRANQKKQTVHSPHIHTSAKIRISVLCYNIHHCRGMDNRIKISRIANLIKKYSPDIAALQEVDYKTGRSGFIDQTGKLARLTGMKGIFCKAIDVDHGKFGNAVLYSSRLRVVNYQKLQLPGSEPRSLITVNFSIQMRSGRNFYFAFLNTHLDYAEESARHKSLVLIEKAYNNSDQTAILAGDLNDIPGSFTIISLLKNWKNATSAPYFFTFPSGSANRQIDYILYRPGGGCRVIEKKVIKNDIASDHYPIFVSLEITDK